MAKPVKRSKRSVSFHTNRPNSSALLADEDAVGGCVSLSHKIRGKSTVASKKDKPSYLSLETNSNWNEYVKKLDSVVMTNCKYINEIIALKNELLKKDADIIRAYNRLHSAQQKNNKLIALLRKKEEENVTLQSIADNHGYGGDLIELIADTGRSTNYYSSMGNC